MYILLWMFNDLKIYQVYDLISGMETMLKEIKITYLKHIRAVHSIFGQKVGVYINVR